MSYSKILLALCKVLAENKGIKTFFAFCEWFGTMGWPKGRPKAKGVGNTGKGRVKGVPNKITQSVKEAFDYAFNANGGAEWLKTWAKDNPDVFFKIYGKRLPQAVEVSGPEGGPMQTIIRVKLVGPSSDPTD